MMIEPELTQPPARLTWVARLPSYAGIGLMAQGPKSEQTTWKRVQKVLPDPDAKTITLRKGRTDLAVLYCMPENYDQVLAWLQARVK